MTNQLLLELYKHPGTVFTLKEASLLVPAIPYSNLKRRIAYLAKTGALRRLSHGIYGKEGYNKLELANKLYAPSYVSLETVLRQAGVVFQFYEAIFSVSYVSRSVTVDGKIFQYRQMNKRILLDKQGLSEQDSVTMASPERAFLDAVYLYKDYHFDNLGALNWDKVQSLQAIYQNKQLQKRVKQYYKIYKGEHVG
jgi:hypothetical protein